MMYACVVVSIAHTDVDSIFHYSIPERLEGKICKGMRIKVPFGKGNKIIEGYVADITGKADIDPKHIKEIDSVCEEYPIISEKRLELAKWMQNKYYTSLSACIQRIVPKRVKEKSFACVRLNTENENLQSLTDKVMSRDTKQKRVLSMLLNGSTIPVSHIESILDVDSAPITALVKKGILVKTYEKAYRGNFSTAQVSTTKPPALTSEQKAACDAIYEELEKDNPSPILIHGVTGSGKTEIYLRAIDKVLRNGKSAIVLVPEISLTPQTVERFVSRFGDKVAVTHSKLNDGERYDQWTRALSGEISVMIGPRSAIFTPFENPGIIIIDEEHEQTYKSDQLSPKYDTREVAEKLSELYGCCVVLGSATPSVLSYYKAEQGKYRLCTLKNRVNHKFPAIKVVDMRIEMMYKNFSLFSKELREAITENLEKKEQIILFLNRRGYSTFVSCRNCGYVMTCDNCNVSYTYHKEQDTLCCHYCGKTIKVPEKCPSCGSEHIRYFGTGTEKIASEVNKYFPEAKVLRMDLDTTRKKNSHAAILEEFRSGKADILVGTQMIAKGLDFSNVTLVGIVSADLSLNLGDYKSSEITYQLVSQVAGRSGRAEKKGKVIIQTYNPGHYSIRYAAKNDYKGFYDQEISYRRQMIYPPFTNLFNILFTCMDEQYLKQCMSGLKYIMDYYNRNEMFTLLGPTPAIISKIKNNYRWQMTVKCENEEKLKNYVLFCIDKLKTKMDLKKVGIQLNMNPGYA